VILLQVDSVEPRRHEATFHVYFQGPNTDQDWGTNSPRQSDLGHNCYLSRHVYPLNRDQRAAYVATMVQWILEFLEMWEETVLDAPHGTRH
jgi:hypothetical protein